MRLFFAAVVSDCRRPSLTRFEGLLLLIPLAVWSAARWRALQTVGGTIPTSRGRLAIGALACAATLPAAAAFAWFVFRHGGLSSDGLALRPFVLAGESARTCAATMFGGASGHSSILPPTLGPMSFGRMLEIYLPTVAKGVTPLWAAMFVVGAMSMRGEWRRPTASPWPWSPSRCFCGHLDSSLGGAFLLQTLRLSRCVDGLGTRRPGRARISAWAAAGLQRLGGGSFAAWASRQQGTDRDSVPLLVASSARATDRSCTACGKQWHTMKTRG